MSLYLPCKSLMKSSRDLLSARCKRQKGGRKGGEGGREGGRKKGKREGRKEEREKGPRARESERERRRDGQKDGLAQYRTANLGERDRDTHDHFTLTREPFQILLREEYIVQKQDLRFLSAVSCLDWASAVGECGRHDTERSACVLRVRVRVRVRKWEAREGKREATTREGKRESAQAGHATECGWEDEVGRHCCCCCYTSWGDKHNLSSERAESRYATRK